MANLGLSKKIIAGAGASIISFTTVVFAYIDSKTADVNQRVEDKYITVKEYVDVRHSAVEDKLNKIESILIRIEDRIYKLNQKGE